MSKNVAVFVDVANLYYSARGQDTDVDYVALLKAATKGRDLIRAYAYSGLDPENENQRKFIDFLNKNGYKVVHKDIRKFGDGRVKANLDIELVVDLFRLADRMDIAVIVSGDGDFAPAIRALQDKGVRCEVISFRPNTSSDLIAVADEFFDIMKIIGIGRSTKEKDKEAKSSKAMSAPEMPAKEVVPEFGFRDASPSVAAAALAALREGRDGREAGAREAGGRVRGRGRGGRTSKPEAPVAPEAVTEVAPAVADGNGAADAAEGEHRRRRRRGGRGRGRGRAHAARGEAEGAPVDAAEPGWTELDDISQIEGLDEGFGLGADQEHEYSFEEADAETLAELGLLDAGTQVGAAVEPVETATAGEEGRVAKPRRRSRAKAPGADAAAEPAAAEAPAADEKPAPRRRSRAKAAAAEAPAADEKPAPRRRSRATPATEPQAGAGEPEKPARRRSTRSRAAAEAAGEEPGNGEGIWKRFRSARGDGQGS